MLKSLEKVSCLGISKIAGLGDEACTGRIKHTPSAGSGTVAQCGKHSESLNTMQIFYRHSMKLPLR